MAEVEKFTRSQVYRLLAHNERAVKGEHKNKDIVKAKSICNYRLFTERKINNQTLTDREYYKHRVSQLKVWDRADVKTLCSWIVTLPEHVKLEDEQRFFMQTVKFMALRYGAENIISAWVHKDEKTPHAHIAFIPTPDGRRVSAKDVINLKELTIFHDDFQKFMDNTGIKGARVKTGYTRQQGGNRTVKQMKKERGERLKLRAHEQKGVYKR